MIAEHWINNLIRPVFLMMLFVRAEQEGEFPLHLYACRQMIPYFFAAGHVNYARYGLCHLLSMSRLPSSILDQYLKGEHVLRHREGIWNGNWSDMMIETSYMNLAKVRMELLEKQQSQDRCKSGPKVNTRAVKYSNLWIPSERFMKLE